MKKFQKGLPRSERGQSLFEVVLAIAVLTLVLGGLASLATVSVRNSTFSRNKTLSSKYAQEASEWLRSERDTDRDVFISRAGAVDVTVRYCLQLQPLAASAWSNTGACLASEVIANTQFKRDLTLVKRIKSLKTVIEADVVVSWEDSQGSHEARSMTYFSDWRER